MLDKLEKLIINMMQGLGASANVSRNFYFVIVTLIIIGLTLLVFYIFKFIFREVSHKISKKTKTILDDELVKCKFFTKLSLLFPLIFCDKALNLFFVHYDISIVFISVLFNVMYVLWFYLVIFTLLSAWNVVFDRKNLNSGRSITNIVQAFKVILSIIVLIVVISILFNKSTSIILKSVGALSALLMLIFKDTILGFIGGIQLAFNKIILIGDWIEMPQFNADGTVIEISLVFVKVSNWDKTVTTIPTYSLVTNPVKNWRSASKSGTRRIARTVNIDMSTVKFCDDELLKKLSKVDAIKEYIVDKDIEISEYNQNNVVNKDVMINGRRQTNIGIFRVYLFNYLKNHPKIDKNSTILVRQLQMTNYGIPIQIYVFTNTSSWQPYEDIQSDIFDHILASIKYFDLRIFQSPTGKDLNLNLNNS